MRDSVHLKYSFFYIAAFVIIVAGLKLASEVVSMLLMSLFLSSIFLAIYKFLRKYKIPKIGAYLIIFLIIFSLFMLLSYIFSTSLNNFITNLPIYENSLKKTIFTAIESLEAYSINIQKEQMLKAINFGAIFKLSTDMIGNVSSLLSKTFLVFVAVAFILSESDNFLKKFEQVFGKGSQKMQDFKSFSQNIQRYFIIKTFTSLLTGFMVFLMLKIYHIEYPLLWGVVAFLFNFVPFFGSIIASIPGIIFAVFKGDLTIFLSVSILYLVINVTISNIIEPKIMGDGLGLSVSAIFFSLIFWGYVLGVAGMFLAVPITMTIKMASERMKGTQWLGLLLSKNG